MKFTQKLAQLMTHNPNLFLALPWKLETSSRFVENMVSDGVIKKHGEKQGTSYYFPEQSDNSTEVVSDTQEVSSEETVDSTQVKDTRISYS